MQKKDIVKGLKALGLKKGDHVFLHASLSSLGYVTGGADTVVDAFLEALGKSGTLVVPTFVYTGIIPETVKKRRNAIKSIHPKASVAAIGDKAKELCRDHWKPVKAHAERTPYTKLRDLDGYVCLLGVDFDRCTIMHTAEELLEMPYLSPSRKATFKTPEGEVTKCWKFFPGPHRSFIGLDRMLAESGKMRIGRIGKSVVRLIRIRDLLELCMEAARKNPAFALCDNPSCADCVEQRAAIRRDIFAREAFTLAASSSLAGRYVPEMIENLKAAGIDAIELDYIQGRSVETISAVRLAAVVKEFKGEKIRVTAVRLNAVTTKTEEAIGVVAKARIPKIVLPLSHDAAAHARLAKRRRIPVSFFNTVQDGGKASEILFKLKEKKINAGFTFSAANFARAGEMPFLVSFKTKVKRFMDGLDVEDARYDGTPTALAEGNAEIKEMISILRCEGFSGTLTLTAGNRYAGNLLEATKAFVDLW